MLALSGGIDPATPPRHGERVVRALGPMARHVVVANAGHGVLGIGCMRDVVFRFIDASEDRDALAVDAALRGRRAAAARLPAGHGRGRRRHEAGAMIEVRGLAKSFAAPAPKRAAAGARGRVRSRRPSAARRRRRRERRASTPSATSASTRPNGRITGLLGPNGAGKTTTLRMLAALITPEAGTMRVDGIDVVARPREVLARMGVLSDSRGLYPRLTARENIVYYGALHGMEREAADARAQDLARMFDMTALLDRRAAGFSQGERMKTALVRALVHDPANIVLDEPTNGLDVLATRALRDSLRWLRSPEGGAKCIVFSTHIMQEVERLCDSVVVVAHGRTVATGTRARAARARPTSATSRKPSSSSRSCPSAPARSCADEAIDRRRSGSSCARS